MKSPMPPISQETVQKVRLLQSLIAEAETQPAIPLDSNLSIFALSKELIAEASELAGRYQALVKDHAQLLKHSDGMAESLMYRELAGPKSFYLLGNA